MTKEAPGFGSMLGRPRPAEPAAEAKVRDIDRAGERHGFHSREAPPTRRRRQRAPADEPVDQLNLRAAVSDINAFVDFCERERIPYREGFARMVARIPEIEQDLAEERARDRA